MTIENVEPEAHLTMECEDAMCLRCGKTGQESLFYTCIACGGHFCGDKGCPDPLCLCDLLGQTELVLGSGCEGEVKSRLAKLKDMFLQYIDTVTFSGGLPT